MQTETKRTEPEELTEADLDTAQGGISIRLSKVLPLSYSVPGPSTGSEAELGKIKTTLSD